MGLFGSPNVARLKAKGDVHALIRTLGYRKQEDVRRAAAEALGEIGDSRAVEPLVAALAEDYACVREAVTQALGRIGDPRAVEPLITALGDPNEHVRTGAALGLGELGDLRAAEPLIAVGKSSAGDVREAATQALTKIGDPGAVELLSDTLVGGEIHVRLGVYRAIQEIPDYRAVERLIKTLGRGGYCEMGERLGTAGALRGIPDPHATAPLIDALMDLDQEVGRIIVDALQERRGPRAREPVTLALLDTARALGEAADARVAAAHALGRIGDSRAVGPLITALKDTHLRVRRAAVGALGRTGDSRAVEPLLAVLRDADCDVRKAAADVLDKLEWKPNQDQDAARYWVTRMDWQKCVSLGSPAVGPLILALKDRSPEVGTAAAEALGLIGDSRAVEPLVDALNMFRPEGDRAAEAAAVALERIGDPRAVGLLAAALEKQPGSGHRWIAVSALSRIGGAPAVEALIAEFKPKERDGCNADSPQRVVEALARIGAPAVEPLIRALQDDDVNTRVGAANALGEIGDARAVQPLVVALKDRSPSLTAYRGVHVLNENVRSQAARALGLIGDLRAIQPLSRVTVGAHGAPGDPDWFVRLEAVEALGQLRAVEPLATAVGDREPEVSCRAVEALAAIGGPRAVEALVASLDHPHQDARASVAQALVSLGWEPANDGDRARLVGAKDSLHQADYDLLAELGAVSVPSLLQQLGKKRAFTFVYLPELATAKADVAPAVDALTKVLERDAQSAVLSDLRQLAGLHDIDVTRSAWQGGVVDCSVVRQLAAAEIARRGLR